MMNINDEIIKMLEMPGIIIESDPYCDSSVMNSRKHIADMIMACEFVDEMEIYSLDIIQEIARVNRNCCRYITTSGFSLAALQKISNLIRSSESPRIMCVHKNDSFTDKELRNIQRILKTSFVEQDERIIYTVDTIDAEYPIDMNLLKLYSLDVKELTFDYVLLNDLGFDKTIDEYIGSKKFIIDSIQGIKYHCKKMGM